MTVREAIARRSSTRGFTPEPLTEEELNAILEAGLQAPTATDRQEIHFTVLHDGDPVLAELEREKNRLYGISPEKKFYYGAPAVVILSGEKDFHWSGIDAGIAVQSMRSRRRRWDSAVSSSAALTTPFGANGKRNLPKSSVSPKITNS